MRLPPGIPLALLVSGAVPSAAQEPAVEPIAIRRAASPIAVDGDLTDPGWEGAAHLDRFYETDPGENVEPKARTEAWVSYDDRYFYVAVKCHDPEPERIRAPYVERDNVIGTDDNVAVYLDTRDDRRSAVELRVSPRGLQGDAVFNEASSLEDFAPDFLYDTAARITAEGWQAELRVPFTSLRYPEKDPQQWGIRIWRNYPREYRYAIYSTPAPRGSNCYLCHLAPLTGLTGLPSSSGLLLVPYATGQDVASADPGQALGDGDRDGDAGLDVKWTPTASTAVDLTLNPDFSQVEADVAQIAVNERFALFFPEKRPFFLEGVDLLDTPIQAAYTRTITSPRGGARVTGRAGASAYTALVAEDRGGGLAVIPGPTSSAFAPQDFQSWVGIGRLRHSLGRSFVGALATGRQVEGGGHNWVGGPDFQWRENRHRLTGQLLLSHSRTPRRRDLAAEWDGRALSGHGLSLAWGYDSRGLGAGLEYRDFADDFRDDQGFVPQVGYRGIEGGIGHNFWPQGFLRRVRAFAEAEYRVDRDGNVVHQRVFPGVLLIGGRNLVVELDANFDRVRAGERLLDRQQLAYFAQIDPSRVFTRLVLQGFVGEDVDLAGARLGTGASVTAQATVRPHPRLTLDLVSARRWLDVAPASGGDRHRLFTAQVQRLKATYGLSARAFVRLIGQYVATENDVALSALAVARREGEFSGSALFSYRLNWQTALFLGYGDDRALDAFEDLRRTQRSFFVKLSYALQR